MSFQHIEKLQQAYTDKYVVVVAKRPELVRFKDIVGRVRTVNMSGRALVEFLDYHLNIGWYDIDVDYLKVVDKPKPKEKPVAKKPPAKKLAAKSAPPGEKKLSPLEKARALDAKKKKENGSQPKGNPSTADILAHARGKKPATGAAKPKPAKPSGKAKMSIADKLAAARGDKEPTADSKPVEAAPVKEPPKKATALSPMSDSSDAAD